ncbi:MAG TPA: PaaI family thioesterase [Parvibaculum sp.]|jgi:uncharacterized protein (TIGR00369 family)
MTAKAPDSDAEIASRLAAAWNAQGFMRLVGAKAGEIRRGFAEIHVDNRPEISQQHGFVHGGVVGFLADNAIAGAAGTVRPDGMDVLTAEYKINLMRPAIGSRIVARGEVVKAGRTQCVVEARVYGIDKGEEKLIAIALGTVAYIATGK